ncbi:MAG: YitT family protein [Lachnospiraceae bacterium]|nr:YitT family protein [Lachnospiraceae bacterium]
MKKFYRITADLAADVCCGLLLAAAFYCFAIPADFPMAGVSGLSLIFYHMLGLPVGVMTIVLNIPIAICCYQTLGKRFYINSLKTTLITSLIIDAAGPALPAYHGERILSAICAGVFCGVGYALAFMRNSSTGGFDFIMMTVRHYRPHLSLGRIAFTLDVTVILISGLLFGDVDTVIFGIILNYIYTTVLDRVLYGTSSGKLTLIVTDVPAKMIQTIDEKAGRGSTVLKAAGGYSKEDKSVVMCASGKKEMYRIRKLAHEVDESAFVIILESNEVIGEGFRLPGDMNPA